MVLTGHIPPISSQGNGNNSYSNTGGYYSPKEEDAAAIERGKNNVIDGKPVKVVKGKDNNYYLAVEKDDKLSLVKIDADKLPTITTEVNKNQVLTQDEWNKYLDNTFGGHDLKTIAQNYLKDRYQYLASGQAVKDYVNALALGTTGLGEVGLETKLIEKFKPNDLFETYTLGAKGNIVKTGIIRYDEIPYGAIIDKPLGGSYKGSVYEGSMETFGGSVPDIFNLEVK